MNLDLTMTMTCVLFFLHNKPEEDKTDVAYKEKYFDAFSFPLHACVCHLLWLSYFYPGLIKIISMALSGSI